MSTQTPLWETRQRQWASKTSRKTEIELAALGLAQVVLLPDDAIDDDFRSQCLKRALALDPNIGSELMAMAWISPGCQPRRMLASLSFSPLEGRGRADPGRMFLEPGNSGSSPLMLAIAHGNIGAIEQAIDEFGMDPDAIVNAGESAVAVNDQERRWRPTQGAQMLAWALFFQQWGLATMLWKRGQGQTDMDRALFECVRGMSSKHATENSDHPAPESDIEGGLEWINTLMDAGANPGAQVGMSSSLRGGHEWFHGTIHGMDVQSLKMAGWEFAENARHHAYTHYGRREKQSNAKPWSAAEIVFREDTLLSLRQARVRRSDDECTRQDKQHRLDRCVDGLGRLFENLEPHTWNEVLNQFIDLQASQTFTSQSTCAWEMRWPEWINAGWQQCDAAWLVEIKPGNPRCAWLDLIGIHGATFEITREHLKTIRLESGRALDTIAARIPATTDTWARGMQRRLAVQPDALNTRNAPLAGLDTLLQRLPAPFQATAQEWMDEYRQTRKLMLEIKDQASPKANALKDELMLQRQALPSIGQQMRARNKPRL